MKALRADSGSSNGIRYLLKPPLTSGCGIRAQEVSILILMMPAAGKRNSSTLPKLPAGPTRFWPRPRSGLGLEHLGEKTSTRHAETRTLGWKAGNPELDLLLPINAPTCAMCCMNSHPKASKEPKSTLKSSVLPPSLLWSQTALALAPQNRRT